MRRTLTKHWFLVGLSVLIPSGLLLGRFGSPDLVSQAVGWIDARVVTATVLFLVAFTLASRKLMKAAKQPGPVAVACMINSVLLPLAAWPLAIQFESPDLRLGLMVAAAVPCTLSAASVWTRQAGGNDAVALLVTLVTNALCFLTTPFWIANAAGVAIDLDPAAMTLRLLLTAVLPMAIGQAVRAAPPLRNFADRFKQPLTNTAQALILTVVFAAAAEGGLQLAGVGDGAASNAKPPTGLSFVLVGLAGVSLHVVALVGGFYGSRVFGIAAVDRAAIAFAGSQKTMPVALLVATSPTMLGADDLLGPGVGAPFVVFPMLMYHTAQLFIDTAAAKYFRKETEDVAEPVTPPAADRDAVVPRT
ncbi:bile acid:sodium symporter family protein [Stratiformator vulcanicus]|uniref:Sodium Bile acid symporter family protein n=1 Tax=Stratiformator vulcanicus TaxID=2527980 RepID=A0A517QVX5_9PLAN|nr:bile acid:sodium symporter [Stratiformator vulcanicus]QDT35805.1 Sodium Bile acid symporter family protein [Stratiformator vulcanicus]